MLDLCQTLCGKVKIMTFKTLLKIPKDVLNKATHLGKEGCRTNIVATNKWVSTIDNRLAQSNRCAICVQRTYILQESLVHRQHHDSPFC